MLVLNSPLRGFLLLLLVAAETALVNGHPLVVEPRAACSTAENALASGIQMNIGIQNNEQSSLAKVKAVVSAKTADAAAFGAAKQQLLGFVNDGISVRANNQKIAPAGNKAIAGLATVQKAQAEELSLVKGLTGGQGDLTAIATLEKDFAGGIKQNQQNLKDALSGCTPAKAGAAKAGAAKASGGKTARADTSGVAHPSFHPKTDPGPFSGEVPP